MTSEQTVAPDAYHLSHDPYDLRRFDWRMLLSEHISGTCLDLFAGFGTRSFLLAELCEAVYAVDPRDNRLQFLTDRSDFDCHDRIHSVCAPVDVLPFSPNSFDLIVATGEEWLQWCTGEPMRERIAELQTLLKDDGSLIINLPGWPTTSGIAGQFGIGDTSNASLRFGRLSKSLSATPRGYEKTLRSAGFTVIDCYTHLPTVANVQYSFNASSHEPIRWLTSRYRNHADIRYRIARRLSLVGDQTGLLKHCYPSYLVVASNDTSIDTRDSSLVESEDVILSHGRSRAALLHLESGSLEKVVKVPNRTRHGEISEREGRVLTSLKETQSSTTTNLPDGETIETRFGSARVEQPASGTPLSSRLDSCPETFRTVLEIGAEWITAFQRDYRCDESTLSVDDLAQQLTVEELEVSPPSIDSHSQLYYTPVHGDFHPQNIFANEDTVTTVIDWEHAVLRGNPLVDPTFFLLQVSRIIFGDLQTGFERIFLDDTEHASIAREYVESLCRDSGVDVETFLLHLPSGWIHQLGIEYEIGTSMTYTARPDEKREWVTFVWDHIDQINLDD